MEKNVNSSSVRCIQITAFTLQTRKRILLYFNYFFFVFHILDHDCFRFCVRWIGMRAPHLIIYRNIPKMDITWYTQRLFLFFFFLLIFDVTLLQFSCYLLAGSLFLFSFSSLVGFCSGQENTYFIQFTIRFMLIA